MIKKARRTQHQEMAEATVEALHASRPTPPAALILFAHGARDPEWSAPFRDIQRRLAARRPDIAVELAFLEIMQPALPETVEKLAAAGCRRITVAPLFMGQGGHLKRDLPQLIEELRRHHPAVSFELLPAAGDADCVREAISGWLAGTALQDAPA
jgi:sirohydrochlorin cobaltochelatase